MKEFFSLLDDLGDETGDKGYLGTVYGRADYLVQKVLTARLARMEHVSTAVGQSTDRHDCWHDHLHVAHLPLMWLLRDQMLVL